MAQVEFAGIKFTGGKMAVVITLITSLIGGLWGGCCREYRCENCRVHHGECLVNFV